MAASRYGLTRELLLAVEDLMGLDDHREPPSWVSRQTMKDLVTHGDTAVLRLMAAAKALRASGLALGRPSTGDLRRWKRLAQKTLTNQDINCINCHLLAGDILSALADPEDT
jgi:hypothetical protein